MSLCKACRQRADRLSEDSDSPDRFKLKIGLYSEFAGHEATHNELQNMYNRRFGAQSLDNYLTA